MKIGCTQSRQDFYGGNIPFIKSGEIDSNKTESFLSNLGLKNSSAKIVNKGTILYALYGATSGEVSISKIKGAINQAILAIIPDQNISSIFLCNWLKRNKNKIINTYLQGGQGNLSAEIINSLLFYAPSFLEQRKIASFFDTFDSLLTLRQREPFIHSFIPP